MVQLVSSSYLSVAFTTAVFVAGTTNNNASVSEAFSMNLFDRFARVTKSNVNNVMNRFESPEKIISQAVIDMQNDLVNVRQSYAEATANQRRLIKKREQMDNAAQDWYRRAQLAVEKGNDVLAKEALIRRQIALDEVNNIIQQINIQDVALEKLYNGMVVLEKQIIESQAKKDQMISRARTARATTKVNNMLSGIAGTSTAMDAFRRMEEKVESLEAQAEISMDMIRIMDMPSSLLSSSGVLQLPHNDKGLSSSSSSSNIEREFQLLETQSSVEDELVKIKTQLLLDGTTTDTGSRTGGSTKRIPELLSPATTTSTTSTGTTTIINNKEPLFLKIPVTSNI